MGSILSLGGSPAPGAGSHAVLLDSRRVYVLPTRHGIVFGVVLLLMLSGAINYNLGLGYALTFLLASMALVSVLHTTRNLGRLSVRPGRVEPVFAGDTARFPLLVENTGPLARQAIGITDGGPVTVYCDVPGLQTVAATLNVPAPRRGMLRPGRVTIFTRFPLGLFRAWSTPELSLHCLVYPRPEEESPPLPEGDGSQGEGVHAGPGPEDFAGLRGFQVGDPPRHVAWKAAARGQGLLTKQFSGQSAAETWLEWSQVRGLGVEAALSRLTHWVLEAESRGLRYGLRLPGVEIPPGHGEPHRSQCLEALALANPG